ncbi:unnamed protein product [Anisakis simplex]|uniref:T-cell activation inhibitor, mitochondrial (inferred by orthology to a human protein) n=1 Tax=Anisakis simplex TaxID=6269 RepID=A0A0M3K4D4_ANISI|nr:unnamed protein product [Anisakis simplex]
MVDRISEKWLVLSSGSTFNGYLNDLFPLRRVPDPVKVEFYLAEKNVKNLRKVQISLSGTDARSIVVTALTQCNLPTKNVPTTLSDSVRSGKPRNSFDSSEMDAAEEMMRLFRKKRSKYFRRNDLTAALKKHKVAASEAVRAFEKTSELLKEEIAELRERAGVTEIFWTTDWSKSHMRRCLVSVNRVIDHASASHNTARSENPIVAALRGYCLRLVNAKTCMHASVEFCAYPFYYSFICCDGGVQFGVQDVPEEWEHVCDRASVQRAQLDELRGARAKLSQLFGNAHIIITPELCLPQTVDQIQSLIVRIMARDESEKLRLETLGRDTLIEVVSAYGELAIGKDGRLFVPCNSAIGHLIEFMNEKAHLSRQINATIHQQQCDVENVRRDCIGALKLRDLTWQQGINLEELLSSMHRLRQGGKSLHELLVDMALHFSTNPTIHVMTDGRLSVPLEWV